MSANLINNPSRPYPDWPTDLDAQLARLRLGTSDYKRVLGAIVKKNNYKHRLKNKTVSVMTMIDRDRFLFAFFRELRHDTRYDNLDPRVLANRHIQVMVNRWVKRGLSTATIHNYLSFLRTFAVWIGKQSMVREPNFYLGKDSPHAHRTQVASEDHSWSAKNVDIERKIEEVLRFDEWVGLQLALCHRFGLRGKEARYFRPHGAVIPREQANPRDAQVFPECDTFVRIVRGAKGGRMRDVPILTDAQRELLDCLRGVVPPGAFVGNPTLTAHQAEARFFYVIRKFGIARDRLGVVAHGLRHEYVNNRYGADAGAPSAVRGGQATEASANARHRAAISLGHNRVQVTSCYLGSSAVMRSKPSERSDPTAEPDGSHCA
jgi:Integrase/Phage integrase, N-terminal